MDFNKLYNNAKAIDMEQIVGDAIMLQSPTIVGYIKEQQLRGEDGDGQKISPQYSSDKYASIKYEQNPKPGLGTPDLYLEGDTHEGLEAVPRVPDQDSYDVVSDTEYFPELKGRYISAYELQEGNRVEAEIEVTTEIVNIFLQDLTK